MIAEKGKVKLPKNVVHQLGLWAQDYDKVKAHADSLWVSGFLTRNSFVKTCSEIDKLDKKLLLWRWGKEGCQDDSDDTKPLPYALVVPDLPEIRKLLKRSQPGIILPQ
eukprot:TRINITY_DN28387_c0_g1_i3.p1 TRINITY_DN28387_c0_g1~~TRINITY_DN28387_c0_g1_i3.p1  ORF type:complete len:108 (-),score=21.21 TRINITY_DN28387_c0_g1_i3:136-459(-)